MAIGDAVVIASTSVIDDAFLTIQPASGVEWIIHNIYIPPTAAVELYATDGTNDILMDLNQGGYMGYFFHLTNAQYMKVKNVSGGTVYMKYDGIVSKSS
jgi:hypothetical protein